MISKLKKIKNLGLVFNDYTWDSRLSSFKQFNLFYGWNGCGKTTLSRLFGAIDGTKIEDLEYEVEDGDGNKYKQGDVFPKKIRVFNQEYIQNNVKIIEGRTNAISILLGQENKDLVEKIAVDRKSLNGDPANVAQPGKISLHAKAERDRVRKSKERDSHFTEIAKTIGAAIGGNALRDYRKPQAEKEFAVLKSKSELTQTDLEKYLLSVKQESLPLIDTLILPKVDTTGDGNAVRVSELLQSIQADAKILLESTVQAEVVSRLASNDDIAKWVEEGIYLHKKHASDVCEYCLQSVPKPRIEQLALHFNEADKKIKEEIELLLQKLRKCFTAIESVRLPDRARFYPDLQSAFDVSQAKLVLEQTQLLKGVESLAGELKEKKSKTTEAVTPKSQIETDVMPGALEEVGEFITLHNKTTAEFETLKNAAAVKLKAHYLGTIYESVKTLDGDLAKLKGEIETLAKEIDVVQKRIAQDMGLISSKHKACETINEKLTTFLGHQELHFAPHTEKDVVTGYNIMRGPKPASYLSEGEKTAIAFVYFVVHLGDENFIVKDGIVVIDDPISSLDSNSIYQAFSFLKNAVKDGGQVFILTHNFDFLKLLINWRKHAGGAGYYMVKNTFLSDVRCAFIDKMDKELSEYESEYHYLFKMLKQMRDEQDNTIAKAYPVPNIARKVWDTFLMFRVPNGQTVYKKMEELKQASFDEQKLDAIYKFTNDQSHITGAGFNPALVPEAKKVVKELFEMMAAIAPDHFKIIDGATN